MSNHFPRIHAYIFLIGSAAPSFPSALFLTFLALHFAQQQRFLLSSILFTSVAIAQVALNPLYSRLLRHVSARRECSLLVIARLLIFTLTGIILALIENERDPRMIVIAFIIFLAVWSLDFVIVSKSPIWAQTHYSISFSQSSAIINLVSRGALAFSPVLASQLIGGNFKIPVVVLAISFGFSALSPFYLKKMGEKADDIAREDGGPALPTHFWSPWANWYVSFLFFANFSVASLSFVILTSQNAIFYGVPLYTVLYASFLSVQVLIGFNILKLPSQLAPVTSRAIFAFMSLLVIFLGLATSIPAAVSCVLIIGTCYAFLMPVLAQSAFGKLTGDRFREYLASGKTTGRIASFASTWIAGLAIAIGTEYRTLLIFIGIAGCAASLAIRYFERKLIY